MKDDRVSLAMFERLEQRRSKVDMTVSPRRRQGPWPKEGEHPIEEVKSRLPVPTIEPLPMIRALPPIAPCSGGELTGGDENAKLASNSAPLVLYVGWAFSQLRDLATDMKNQLEMDHAL